MLYERAVRPKLIINSPTLVYTEKETHSHCLRNQCVSCCRDHMSYDGIAYATVAV
jgi:hypothetical protein